MNFTLNKLLMYCETQSSTPSDILIKLERETYLKTLAPQMISGTIQGRVLSFISQLIQPDRILEIGTFTGYGTLCLAEGLGPKGKINTIEANPEYENIYKRYFRESEYWENIEYLIGDAIKLLNDFNDDLFDLIFVDASKRNYKQYFQLAIQKLKTHGVMLFDNVLWSGKVVMKEKDIDTRAIHDFNTMVASDHRVKQLILPIRDGIMILIKK